MSTTYTRTESGDWAGLTTLVGGALLLGAFIVDIATGTADVPSGMSDLEALAFFGLVALSGLLLAAGLASIAFDYRRKFGTLGFIGLVAAAVGFLVMAMGALLTVVTGTTAVDSTLAGNLMFGGLIVATLSALVTGIALWRHRVARVAAALLVVAFLAFLMGAIVGETFVETMGFDLMWVIFGLSLSLGWTLFGNYVRTGGHAVRNDRTAPVA